MNRSDNEYAFFTVLSMDDVWKELKKHMYPNKKSSSLASYRDGDIAAYYGYLSLIKENTSLTFTKEAMNFAAMNGHLDVVKWLHENRKEGCTINAMDWGAKFGHLDIVIWLHDNRTEGCTTNAMDWAGGYGHLEVVKWLDRFCS